MGLDDLQVVPGAFQGTEQVVPSSSVAHANVNANSHHTKKGSGLTKVPSVRSNLAGYGVIVGNNDNAAVVGYGGPVVPGIVGVAPPHPYGVVGMPYPYAHPPHGANVPHPYTAPPPYGYSCVGVAPPPQKQARRKTAEKLPEVTSGSKRHPRWSTPRRTGKWKENWQCAKDWGPESSVTKEYVKEMCEVVRCAVSDEVSKRCKSLGVGRATVEKWMCLLAEYLELNGDEHVLLAVLISRYGKGKRGWTGEHDWCRPQQWECVVAIAAYLAVLLSEEFPGKVAQDLQELLGRNFRFGREQIAFLLAVDWRVNVGEEEFGEIENLIENAGKEIRNKSGAARTEGPAFKTFVSWFTGRDATSELKKSPVHTKKVATPALSKKVPMSPITPANDTAILGKKRSRDMMSSPEEDETLVPGAKKRAHSKHFSSMPEHHSIGIVPSMQGWSY